MAAVEGLVLICGGSRSGNTEGRQIGNDERRVALAQKRDLRCNTVRKC